MAYHPPPSEAKRQEALRLLAAGVSQREAARRVGCSQSYVSGLARDARPAPTPEELDAKHNEPRLPDPAPEAGGPALPEPVRMSYDPYPLAGTPGVWGAIFDVHLPYHDRTTVELFFGECRRRNAAGVLYGGDVLDSDELSDHEKHRDFTSYVDELACGREFFRWARSRLPRARHVYKLGNHDERLERYIMKHARALARVPGFDLPTALGLADAGVEVVSDRRVVTLGKLSVIHGHEYRGGGGVSPARWLYLKARAVAMCGHFHRASEYHDKNIKQQPEAAWSAGCACYLHPRYAPLNNWGHGFAFITLEPDGNFVVENKRVLADKIV